MSYRGYIIMMCVFTVAMIGEAAYFSIHSGRWWLGPVITIPIWAIITLLTRPAFAKDCQ